MFLPWTDMTGIFLAPTTTWGKPGQSFGVPSDTRPRLLLELGLWLANTVKHNGGSVQRSFSRLSPSVRCWSWTSDLTLRFTGFVPVLAQFLSNQAQLCPRCTRRVCFWGFLSHKARGFELRTRNLGRQSNEYGSNTGKCSRLWRWKWCKDFGECSREYAHFLYSRACPVSLLLLFLAWFEGDRCIAPVRNQWNRKNKRFAVRSCFRIVSCGSICESSEHGSSHILLYLVKICNTRIYTLYKFSVWLFTSAIRLGEGRGGTGCSPPPVKTRSFFKVIFSSIEILVASRSHNISFNGSNNVDRFVAMYK